MIQLKRHTGHLVRLIVGVFIFVLSYYSAFSQRNRFSIRGELVGLDSQYIYLNYLPGNAHGVYDSAYVRKGKFRFDGSIVTPGIAHLMTKPIYLPPDTSSLFDFYLEPSDIIIKGSPKALQNAIVIGSKSHADWQAWLQQRMPVFNRNQQLAIEKEGAGEQEKIVIDSFIKVASDTINAIDVRFVSSHPASEVSLEILAKASCETMPFRVYRQLYNSLSKNLRISEKGLYIRQRINLEQTLAIGSVLKDFYGTDQYSNAVSVAKYNGSKYVLLDFGASWCGPCRGLMPVLRDLYSNNRINLEIIGISIQDKKDDWLKYIAQFPTEWPQVREPVTTIASGKSVPYAEYYNLDKIPALLLLDKKGKLVGKYGSLFYNSPTAYMKELSEDINRIVRAAN